MAPSPSSLGLSRFALTSPATSLPTGALEAYVATDDPPSSTLIGSSRAASGTTPVTVPVASVPVTVLIRTTLRLTNVLLADAFRTEALQKYLSVIDPTDFTVTSGANSWPVGATIGGPFTSTFTTSGQGALGQLITYALIQTMAWARPV